MMDYRNFFGLLLIIFLNILSNESIDITHSAFGTDNRYLPAAFGDFNADRLTDMFVIEKSKNGSYVVRVLMSHSVPPLLQANGPFCTYDKLKVKSIIPSDFDGDGAMDIVVITLQDSTYDAHILWGDLKSLECLDAPIAIASFKSQPLLLDYNGDMISDLFGEGVDGNRSYWIFSHKRERPLRIPITKPSTDALASLKPSGGHAFVDINQDLVADLWVATISHFEHWSSIDKFLTFEEVEYPIQKNGNPFSIIGQSTFFDINFDGEIEVLLPACVDTDCKESLLYIYEFSNSSQVWYPLKVNFKDDNEVIWSFPSNQASYLYTETITPRVGDINLDGYPDLLMTVFNGNSPKVILLINSECKLDCDYPRTFVPQWDIFKDWPNSVLGTFFDFEEDGTLDVLLVNASSDGQSYTIGAYKDSVEYDAMFLKVLHLSPNGDHPGILLFDRFFISAPDHPNPFILSGPPLLELIKGLERTEAHAFMLDANLSAAQRASNELALRKAHISAGVGQGMGADANHSGFRLGSWSPIGLSQQGCLICLVTYDHQINIVGQNGMHWVTLSDMTPIWHKYLTLNKKALLADFQKTIGNHKHHEFVAETKFCGVAGSLHPCIVDVSSLENCKDKITSIYFFKVESEEESQLQGYLLTGTVTGDIHLYFISIISENLEVTFINTLPNPTPRMSARHVSLLQLEEENFFVLFCSKNSIFLGFLLNLTPSSCQIGATTFAHTGCLNITGIKVTSPNLVYVSSKDGNIKEFTVEIDTDASSIYISKKELILASDNVTYDGFSTSPHKSFWAILETVSSSYDHLILREPSVVNIFQINRLETISAYLLDNSNVPVANLIDLFESIRLLYRDANTKLLLPKEEEIPSLSFTKKTTFLWFTDIILSSRENNGTDKERENIEKIRKILFDNVLKDHICRVLSNISEEEFPTDSLRKHSLFLMCSFLQQIKATHPMLKGVLAQLKSGGENGEEKCTVCEKIVKFQSVVFAKCSLGHTIPRCLRTLLPTLPFLKCRHCCTFYLQEAENWYKDGDRCVICSSKLNLKSKKRSVENVSTTKALPVTKAKKRTRSRPTSRKK